MTRKATTLFILLAAIVALPSFGETRRRYTITTTAAAPHTRAMGMVANGGEKPLRMRTFSSINGFAADLTDEEAAELRATSGVTSVDPVVERYASGLTGETGDMPASLERYDQQVLPWGLPIIRAAEVWKVTRGEGINVVVLDTGIDYNHPDLKAAYAGGYNVYEPAKLPVDDNFHGTHVAGTIAATDNNFGVVGISPGVKMWIVKCLDASGKSFDEYIAAGIDWAVGKERELGGRWVVNMSLGAAAEGGKLEKQAVDRAAAAGIVLVAAAGNRGADFLDYPAAYEGVIAVGAIGRDGRKADFSSYAPRMNIVAPGVLVESTFLEGYRTESEVLVGTEAYPSLGLFGSAKASLSGKLVNCGLGNVEDFPPDVRGNVALIRRGTLNFRDKARNAKNAGAAAVIIWDHVPADEPDQWTLLPGGCPGAQCPPEWADYEFPLTVSITNSDGIKLMQRLGTTAKATYLFAQYGRLSGTSMATPHVASTAALLLSLNRGLRPETIATILRNTARDTGDPGYDQETGWGVIDALAAAQYVAPDKFNLPPVPYTPPRRRGVRQ
jgi:subtilisin family serine protease